MNGQSCNMFFLFYPLLDSLSLIFPFLLTLYSAPKRPLGPAELLVEASFADLRHGGDGDLSHISGSLQKVTK
jgi:hypothetical protein